jgi:transcriptional regulator with XRE-family HTH domain
MHFYEAFDKTVKKFDLQFSDLAQATGITVSGISNFRKGFNVKVDRVETLLMALPMDARRYFMELVIADEESGA